MAFITRYYLTCFALREAGKNHTKEEAVFFPNSFSTFTILSKVLMNVKRFQAAEMEDEISLLCFSRSNSIMLYFRIIKRFPNFSKPLKKTIIL